MNEKSEFIWSTQIGKNWRLLHFFEAENARKKIRDDLSRNKDSTFHQIALRTGLSEKFTLRVLEIMRANNEVFFCKKTSDTGEWGLKTSQKPKENQNISFSKGITEEDLCWMRYWRHHRLERENRLENDR